MATTKKSSSSSAESKKIKDLEGQVKQLTEQIAMLLKGSVSSVSNNMDREITFISLCNNILNLSTEPNGGGTIYTFYKFGEEQSIPYTDAKLIIKNNKRFIKEGKCYITDDDIIKSEHLTNDYKRILDKDRLLNLFSCDRNTFANLFDAMTDAQKKTFRDIVFERLSKNQNSVDMNIVQIINDSLNIDILKDVKYSKELFAEKE